jgi:predicted nucleic acid-binding protein
MDALVLTAAEAIGAMLVTFDTELIEHGGEHPKDVL